MSMTESERINGWTFEETVKTAENLMGTEENMFKWDVLRHLRDFAETYKEEIQQYRAIGTVEEFAYAKGRVHLAEMASDYMENREKIFKEYVSIGTVEELRELKEKATAKKPYCVQYDLNPNDINYHCPACKRFVLYTHPICSCGQKLDWSEGKE